MRSNIFLGMVFTISALQPWALVSSDDSVVKSFNGYQVLRVRTRSKEALAFLEKLHESETEVYDFWSPPSAEIPVDIAVTEGQAEYLRTNLQSLGVHVSVLIPDLQAVVERSEKDAIRQETSMDWTSYHTADAIYNWIDGLPAQYPKLVKVVEIGKSFQNRSLKLICISNSENSDKPAVWLDGGIHAREWVSPASVTYMISQLLKETEGGKKDGNNLLELFDWYVLPIVNPDGYEYSWTNNRMWRKTRSNYRSRMDDGKRPNSKSIWDSLFGFCAGVDGNRNFNVKWGGKGTSGNPCSEIYRGPKASSESEIAAVQDFLLEHRDRVKLFVTLHSYSQMILIPWAYDDVEPEDFNEMKAIAVKSAEAIKKVHGTVYRPGQTTKLLGTAAGSSKDWAKEVAGIKYSFAFELRDTGKHGFILPAEEIIPTAQEVYAGIRSMAEDVAVIYNVTRSHF